MIEWIVSASILIAVIIVLRFVLKGRISLRLQYALWGLVLLRLLVPVSFGATGLSVGNLTQKAVETETAQVLSTLTQFELPRMTYSAAYSEVAKEYAKKGVDIAEMPVEEYERVDYEILSRMGGQWNIRDILKVVWILGIAAVGFVLLASNIRFAAKLKKSKHRLDGKAYPLPVYVSPEIDTPCLFGLFRPAIYVTPEAAADDTVLHHAKEHELTHYRHGDHIWSLLRAACLALHWYNPLVWWAAVLSRNDAELSCDEATIRRIGEDERAEYGRTLIGLTCQKRPALLLTATTMTGSGRSIKERIRLIAKKPKMAVYTLVAVVLIAAVAVGCTFTGAAGDEAKPWTWMQNLGSDDITSAIVWRGDSAEEQGLSDNDITKLLSLLNSLEKTTFTENKQAAGSTPQYGLAFECGGASYYINEAVSPSGSLEMNYGGKQWWVDNAELEAFIAALAISGADKPWSEVDIARWQEEVPLIGFSVQAEGSYEEIGRLWAESFVSQYVDSASPDNPLYSADAAVLSCSLTAESLMTAPKTLIYNMRFVCSAADADAFERWYVGWAGPLDGKQYPQYGGWMEFGWFIVLEQHGDGEWASVDAGTGGYGGWGYINFDGDWALEAYMENVLAGSGNDSAELVMCSLPLEDWTEFDTTWGAEGWSALYALLDAYCLTEGQVYGPEETRMWSDVYPNDQAYRNLYVMLAALNSDGAYTEGFADILKKQQNYDPELFETCLQNLTQTQRNSVLILVGTYS